jgi:mono/diheme cytochrome c family protein
MLVLAAILLTQAPPARSAAELRAVYQEACAACHGRDGSAMSPEGLRLKGRAFTSPEEMKGLSDADLAATIRKGLLFGLRMPSFRKQLTDEEIAGMVRLIRGARKGEDLGQSR